MTLPLDQLQLSLIRFPPSSVDHFHDLPIGSRFCEVINCANDYEDPREQQITVENLFRHCHFQRTRCTEIVRGHDDIRRCWL